MPHISKRRNQIKNISRKKGRFITQDEAQKVTEVQNGIVQNGIASSNMLLNTKASSNINKSSNMLFGASASSNMLLDYEAPSNISLSRSSHETLQSPSYAALILHMRLGNINKSSNMLLDASASNNILLDYEALSNISLSRSSHETLQSPLYAASILHMRLNNINELSNMLLDASASSNMLLDYEASNDILPDTEASSNILLSLSFHKTLQSSSLPTDTASILYMRLDNINKECQIKKSSKSSISTYDHLHLLSISKYIQLLLDRQDKMNASIQITKTLWNKGDYILFDDDNFLEECQEWLCQQSPESCSPRALKIYIEETLLPKIGHIKDKISEKICQTYMHALGYKYDERKKGVYYDGHEQPDVVLYRKGWLERMFKYKKNMKDFTSDMLEIIVEPELKYAEKELVQVTHNKYHFYANNGQRRIWTREDEDILHSKHIGHSVMVSAFVCPCHGLLQLSEEKFSANLHVKYRDTFVVRSVQEDGYWKSEHMVFCLDQSTNYNAIAENALVASRMNKGPRGKQPIMHDGWYIDEYEEKQDQKITFLEDHPVEKLRGQPKGIQQILEECNLWPAGRISCIYNYNDLLIRLPEALNNVPVTTIRKFARKLWRHIDAYNKGLEGRVAEWAVSKYKSHRRLPESIERMMEQ
ncbi:12932_t:CDS:2 [Gigaspora margarita]|uniref:12932_t:CDS:1 n=1 Tax=Gigaspora margarita TaxID=4874 RepID=A0ABN7UH09_GIGMA|nr:12932_t:CDS:2 [Gigaspora margarita]